MAEFRRISIAKPTLQTPYHIDFNWWSQSENNWRILLMGYLSEEHQQAFKESSGEDLFDVVDPETAEVSRVDGLQYLLMAHYAQQEGFITANTPVVESIFRLLLANGNRPMTPAEIGEKLNRPPETILMVLSGIRVYRGLRPCCD